MLSRSSFTKSARQLIGLASLLAVCAGCSTAPDMPREPTPEQMARIQHWRSAEQQVKPTSPVFRLAVIPRPVHDDQPLLRAVAALTPRNADLTPLVQAGGEIAYVGSMPLETMPACGPDNGTVQGPSYCLNDGHIQFLMPVAGTPVSGPGRKTHRVLVPAAPSFTNSCGPETCFVTQVLTIPSYL